jgi:hypothetical protein
VDFPFLQFSANAAENIDERHHSQWQDAGPIGQPNHIIAPAVQQDNFAQTIDTQQRQEEIGADSLDGMEHRGNKFEALNQKFETNSKLQQSYINNFLF